MSVTATKHGSELLREGFTVAQVVHDYGDACQVIAELALEHGEAIRTEDFRLLNLCLDNAIADAVSEYGRQREVDVSAQGVRHETERLGVLAHELRNLLNSATLAFEVLKDGVVGIQGSTGAVLGRSLFRLRDLIDRSLAEVRLSAGVEHRERISLARFVEEVEVAAVMEAKARGHQLTVAPVTPGLNVDADRHILASVVGNLLQNAFKYTRPQSHVCLRVRASDERVFLDVEDECGGLPPGKQEELFAPFSQRSADRSGLGLGLSISLQGVRALGGELSVRDKPGEGCVFTVELPLSPPLERVALAFGRRRPRTPRPAPKTDIPTSGRDGRGARGPNGAAPGGRSGATRGLEPCTRYSRFEKRIDPVAFCAPCRTPSFRTSSSAAGPALCRLAKRELRP